MNRRLSVSASPLRVVKASHADAARINLRASDLAEAAAWVPGLAPQVALGESIRQSTEAFTGLAGGEVVGIWGYRVARDEVCLWLMCSALIEQHRRAFLVQSRRALEDLLKAYPGKLVCNYVAKHNAGAHRLLSYLGLRMIPSPSADQFNFFYFPKSCA